MEMGEIIKRRRGELGMSQADLASATGVDTRQVRRYEAGQQQPAFNVAVDIAKALGLTVGELAGEQSQRVSLAGDWWMSWQTFKDREEVITAQEVRFRQQHDLIHLETLTRGISMEDGGYMWHGELRLWDNEVLMGWYVANDGPVRSKGTMYFVLHPHGVNLSGRWVGLSYDGKVITGWGAAAKSEEEVRELIGKLKQDDGIPT